LQSLSVELPQVVPAVALFSWQSPTALQVSGWSQGAVPSWPMLHGEFALRRFSRHCPDPSHVSG
jgi:hypothetical protein